MSDKNLQDNELIDDNLKGEYTENMGVEKHANHSEEDPQAEVPNTDENHVVIEDDFNAGESISNEAVEQLQLELEQSRHQAQEYLDGWQRARAEFSNYKKRKDREQAQIYQTTAGNLIKRFLEIADDLERALKKRPQDEEGSQWANGIELIYRKLISTIEAEGVSRIEPEGEYFDPNFHEAISQEDSQQHESGQIIEVLQPGYMLGERVLRPARVRVAR